MPSAFPVIDLFAGPGGLGEGFSSVRDDFGNAVFNIGVSIEKDRAARETLKLRALFRKLDTEPARAKYFDFINGKISSDEFQKHRLIKQAAGEADEEAKCAELGADSEKLIDGWIKQQLGGRTDWVLIGGPPCQVYSLAGRSRRANDVAFEEDERFLLYREYLRVIRKFQPAVFVMENVRGILSARHGGSPIFPRILEDLRRPRRGLDYELRSFICGPGAAAGDQEDFLIRSEDYGIPQARHRVIVLGVRGDYASRPNRILLPQPQKVTTGELLAGLPRLRSKLSKQEDSDKVWLEVLRRAALELDDWSDPRKAEIKSVMDAAVRRAAGFVSTGGRGGNWNEVAGLHPQSELYRWIRGSGTVPLTQHGPRKHMETDLYRYLFAASYARVVGLSPKLRDFPEGLLPAHKNAKRADAPNTDRFRVQMEGGPSTTVTSHISKDGHYYIHPDPSQCRSLTVREAARLQTFPDDYFFLGEATQSYHQVGNAVPPYLAWKLGGIVSELMRNKKTTRRK